jgi:hypothetical protein
MIRQVRQKKECVFKMDLEIALFLLILVSGFVSFLLGFFSKQIYLYLLGSVLLIISGLSLYIFDSLVLGRLVSSVSDAGVISYELISVDLSNPLFASFALVLVVVGVVAVFLFAGQTSVQKRSVFHY